MENPSVTTSFILDVRRAKSDETYPVKLRVIYKGENRRYGTSFSMTKEEFKKVMGERPRDDFKKVRLKLNAVEEKANNIIKRLREFSFDEFGTQFKGKVKNPQNAFSLFEDYKAQLTSENRIGTADSYQCALNSLKEFNHGPTLLFQDITVQFLKKYEQWMINEEENSLTTVGIYLRNLRALYNKAILLEGAMREDYPFGRGKYVIPSPANVKKALTLQDIKKIFDYTTPNKTIEYYRDLWIFSYLCNGANMKDICLLQYSDMDADSIVFRRAKSSNTNRKSKPMVAALTPRLKKIINKWGKKPPKPKDFIFPILDDEDNERIIKKKVLQEVKQTNKYIGRIATECKIPGNITTYTARHSFATILKRSGVNVSFISESMGHSSIKTTENYLGSIEGAERKKIAANLTNF